MDHSFTITTPRLSFGEGILGQAGAVAAAMGLRRVVLMTDVQLAALPPVAAVRQALERAGVEVLTYAEVEVEPTDRSFAAAASFLAAAGADGVVSVGGGSVIDTAKAANLYASWPAEFLDYVNAPIGRGRPVPGPLKPHIACPTTCGTGAEVTGIAIFDLLAMQAKTGIMSPRLVPDHALIDPAVTASLPRLVLAATALDAMCHALEAYTCRPVSSRGLPADPTLRPMTQGANPWSDLIAGEALRLVGRNFLPALADEGSLEARGRLLWAAALAGNAFGNAGCHIPHGMSYAVSGLVRDWRPEGYPPGPPLIPHGISVILGAPAVYRLIGPMAPERHLEAAGWLGAEVRGVPAGSAGEVLAARIVELMKAADLPSGLAAVGYGERDVPALTERALPQRRLLDNAPLDMTPEILANLYRESLNLW
ncbi:hydroxyacid-oxoacid transhydrogenase [Geminicoccaceae bacterium 1502E]|nr:hydroxyacid-oxoacid transhydrogenase [Geminicoccaceae bacterium 1502E]